MSGRTRTPSRKIQENIEREEAAASKPTVKRYIPKKKVAAPVVTRKSKFNLAKCVESINMLPNLPGSLKIYVNAITSFAVFAQPNPEDFEGVSQEEARERLKDFDIGSLIRDYEKTCDIIDNKVKSRKDGDEISPWTKEKMYEVIQKLIGNKAGQIDPGKNKKLKENYLKKNKDYDNLGKDVQRKNEAKGGNAKNPEVTWEILEERWNRYVDTQPMGNDNTGKQRLRNAVIVGLYIAQRPRRLEDYNSLQLYPSMPKKYPDQVNMLVMGKDSGMLHIDHFKIRKTTSGSKLKERLKRYDKALNPKLFHLFKKYIQFFGIDASKHENVFFRLRQNSFEEDCRLRDPLYEISDASKKKEYKDLGFGTAITAAAKHVLGVSGWSCNSFRHAFDTFISQHRSEYNQEQLREISVDVGDTPKDPASNEMYRVVDPANRDKTPTEIQGDIMDRLRAREVANLEAEEEGSVGEVEQPAPYHEPLHKEIPRGPYDYDRIGRLVVELFGLLRI